MLPHDRRATLNVDVVIVTYRSADHLPRCLDALPPVASITVVDNASGDDSAAVARRRKAHVVENSVNRGFAAAANQGARGGAARYILFLNPDAAPEPGCIEALSSALDRDPATAIVGPILHSADGTAQRPAWPFPSARHSWLEAFGRSSGAEEFVVGACLLVRRELFDKLDGFDESFWLYGEEADFARRAAELGCSSRVVAEASCHHIGGASGVGSDRVFEEFQRGTERFIVKHEGRFALFSHRVALLLGSLLRVAVAIALRQEGPNIDTRRRIVRRLVRELQTAPTTVADSPAASSATTLIVLSLEAWDDVWRRNQFLVRELLDLDPACSVVFVEPPGDPLHALMTGRAPVKAKRVERGPLDRLTVVRPVKILPRAAGPIADRLLRRSLRRHLDLIPAPGRTLWVNDPAWAELTTLRLPLLYDVTDDWTRAERPPRIRRRLQRWDRHLTSSADVVVVCSASLLKSHADGRDVRLIPNAVDVQHFRRRRLRPSDLPPRPCLVYMGTLHEDRLDIALITDLADTVRDASVVLIGPSGLGARASYELASRPNVYVFGPRPYEEVPAYLQAADVIIIPHVVSPFTDSLDPIKAYECAAVGRPTVTTPVAGFREHPELFTIAERSRFADMVAEALRNAPPFVGDPDLPTWRVRALDFADALTAAGVGATTRS